MVAKQGFTLMEILIVLTILGIVAAMAIPNFMSSMEQTNAQTAENNLLAILAAEQKYSEDNSGNYCTVTTPFADCGDSNPDLYTNLHLSLSGQFTYSCSVSAGTIPYTCTATDGTDTVTLTPSAVSPTTPITCVNVNGNAGYCPASCKSNGC